MEKRLNIDKPLVFRKGTSLYTKVTVSVLLIILTASPLLIFANTGALIWVGIAISIILAAVSVYLWHFVTADVIVDSLGLEMKSSLWKNRLLWKDAKWMSDSTYRGVTTYTVKGDNSKISFNSEIQNSAYLQSICGSAVHDTPGSDGYFPLPTDNLPPTVSSGPLTTTFLFAMMCTVMGAIGLVCTFDNTKTVLSAPLIPISQASTYLNKKQEIMVYGALHCDEDLASRDGKHKYALQTVRIKDCSSSTRSSASCDTYCLWAPSQAWLKDKTGEIEVTLKDPVNNSLPLSWETQLKKDWKTTGLFDLMAPTFDESIDKKIAGSKSNLDLTLRTIPQDGTVLMAGQVVKCEDHIRLDPTGSTTWIQCDSLDAVKNGALKWLAFNASLLLWGIIGLLAGRRQWAQAKKLGTLT